MKEIAGLCVRGGIKNFKKPLSLVMISLLLGIIMVCTAFGNMFRRQIVGSIEKPSEVADLRKPRQPGRFPAFNKLPQHLQIPIYFRPKVAEPLTIVADTSLKPCRV